MNAYPTDFLIEVDALKAQLDNPRLRVLDVRTNDPRLPFGYRLGHLPHAIALDPMREFFVFSGGSVLLANADQIAKALGKRGIANDSPIVIYDEWTGQLAAMTFWVLQYVGHANVKILHGGWAAWQNAKGAITNNIPEFSAEEYVAHPNLDTRATAEWIQANAARDDVLLLDVRTAEEFRMGHIPGAVNLPFDLALAMNSPLLKDAHTLHAQFERVGATVDKEIVVYCAAGSRSAHSFAVLHLVGYPRVRNYEGSMRDWYQVRGLPVE